MLAVPNHASTSRLPPTSRSRSRRDTSMDSDETSKPGVISDGWTIATFENQPIKKGALPQLLTLVDRLKEMLSKIKDGTEQAVDTAKAIAEVEPDDPSLNQVVEIFQRSLEQQHVMKIKIQILQSLMNRIKDGEEFTELDVMFKEDSEAQIGEYMTKSDRAKFKDDEDYRAFREELWEISHPGKACPPMSRWLKPGPDEDSDDDDIEMGGMTQDYICRISRAPLKEAMTNTSCKHSYSKFAIMDLLENAPGRGPLKAVRCPYESCRAMVSKATLKDDRDLQKKADNHAKRQAQREEEDDDDDEDVISVD